MSYLVRAIGKKTGWISEQLGPYDTYDQANSASAKLRDLFRSMPAEPSFTRERTLAEQYEFRILQIDDSPSGKRTERAA